MKFGFLKNLIALCSFCLCNCFYVALYLRYQVPYWTTKIPSFFHSILMMSMRLLCNWFTLVFDVKFDSLNPITIYFLVIYCVQKKNYVSLRREDALL